MPVEQIEQAVVCKVSIDGAALPEKTEVISAVVRQAVSRPARLELVTTADTAGAFKIGSKIEITGVERRRATKLVIGSARGRRAPASGPPLFYGTVQGVTNRQDAGAPPVAVVVAEDALSKLRQVRVSTVFQRLKSEEMIQQVLSKAGLAWETPATPLRFDQRLVFGQSALDLCMQLAAEAGWLFRCEREKVVFSPADAKPAAVLTCTAGESLIHFSAGAREVPAQVIYRSWDFKNGKALVGEAPVNAERKGTDLVRQSAAQSQDILTELAQGAARELSGMSFVGAGSIPGSTAVRVGVGLDVKGSSVPEGTYLVTACEHRVEAGDYVTNFSVGLSEPLPRPARVPAPLMPGTVAKNFGDTENMGRVMVKLGTMEGETAFWAHSAVPFGGFHFPHAIGDQVLLGFLGDEPPLPVVLGALPGLADRQRFNEQEGNQGKRGPGQIAYGKALLKMAPGEEGPASASLSGPTLKVEVVEGTGPESKVQLAGPENTTVELTDGHVRLKATNSLVDLDANALLARVLKLEAQVTSLISLESSAEMNLKSGTQTRLDSTGQMSLNSTGKLDLKSAMVSINDDALKVV
jgi:uncharacterized protein involved in type VI secretion and phage assembly